jgi:hypothetical protein
VGKEFEYKNWKEISKLMNDRTATQCSGRYKRIRPGIVKGGWTAEEDELLVQLIDEHGKNWSLISTFITSKNSKQIRDRFINKLDRNVKNGKFTKTEDERILTYFTKFGRKWTKIASYFPGRTGDMVKNRFYSCIRKKINHIKRVSTSVTPEEEGSRKELTQTKLVDDLKPEETTVEGKKESENLLEETIIPTQINIPVSPRDEIKENLPKKDFTLNKVEEFSIEPKLKCEEVLETLKPNLASKVKLAVEPPVQFWPVIEKPQQTPYYFYPYYSMNSNIFIQGPGNYQPYFGNSQRLQSIPTNDNSNLFKRNNFNEIHDAQMQIWQSLLKNFLNDQK